ncbi:MAG TPA: TIR domain-containing protein [Fimbriimonas sp.]|nr:TIR domain-containing protein [Fimbriimonas sp.]
MSATEIVHVLFVDIIGYSAMPTSAQSRSIQRLNEAVSGTETYRGALAAGTVIVLPTGDGMALIFSGDVTAPAECAVEIWPRVREVPLRMGIHSGLVQKQRDITGKENVAGEGINTAQRVMDFADSGHILLSEQYASWLSQFPHWRGHVRELGEGVAKHGLKLRVWNLVSPEFGSLDIPARITPMVVAKDVLVLFRRPDTELAQQVSQLLSDAGHRVRLEGEGKIGLAWVQLAEEQIKSADVVVPVVSESSAASETFEFQVETALLEDRVVPLLVGGVSMPQLRETRCVDSENLSELLRRI